MTQTFRAQSLREILKLLCELSEGLVILEDYLSNIRLILILK